MIAQPEPEKLNISETLCEFDPADRLDTYFQLLMDENARINLVSRETSPMDLKRMAAESLHPLRRIEATVTRYLDIGSGGGLPAIPILLSLQPATTILVERTQKKVAALGRMLRSLEIQAEIEDKTYEDCEFTVPFDLISLRYVKLTPKLLRSIRSHLAPGGKLFYYAAPEFTLSNCATFQFVTDRSATTKSYSIISK